MARRNPFRARQLYPGRLPYFFPPGADLDGLIQKFLDHACLGQIVGPHGSGKSTLLLSAAEEFRRRDYDVSFVRLTPTNRLMPPVTKPASPQSVLIIDGWEQVRWWRRRTFLRRQYQNGWGVLVSTHRNLGLPTVWETHVSTDIARKVVAALMDVDGPPDANGDLSTGNVPATLVGDLLEQHHGDMREVLFSLYDWFHRQAP